jgi:hypothetical protein
MVQSINFRKRRRFGSANGQFDSKNDIAGTDNSTSANNVILGPTASRAGGRGESSIGEMAGFGRMPQAPSAGYHPVAA